MPNIKVFAGSGHEQLAENIAKQLSCKKPSQVSTGKFANGETKVQIGESVRGEDVYVVQCKSLQNDLTVFNLEFQSFLKFLCCQFHSLCESCY